MTRLDEECGRCTRHPLAELALVTIRVGGLGCKVWIAFALSIVFLGTEGMNTGILIAEMIYRGNIISVSVSEFVALLAFQFSSVSLLNITTHLRERH